MRCRLRHISRLDPGAGLELDCTDLGTCAQEIVLATLQATATLQDSLLFSGALSPGARLLLWGDTLASLLASQPKRLDSTILSV